MSTRYYRIYTSIGSPVIIVNDDEIVNKQFLQSFLTYVRNSDPPQGLYDVNNLYLQETQYGLFLKIDLLDSEYLMVPIT